MMAFLSQFRVYLPWVNAHLAHCPNSVLTMKALLGTCNQEKALVGAFSMIVKTEGSFAALISSEQQSETKVRFAFCVSLER